MIRGIGVLFAENPKFNGIIEGNLNNAKIELHFLQDMIGGYIEVVKTAISADGSGCDDIILVIDEEGKLKDRSVNRDATDITYADQIIVGDALILGVRGEDIITLPYDWLKKRFRNWELYHDHN